jgi:RNA polymerase sigma factor (sigma-70 family)
MLTEVTSATQGGDTVPVSPPRPRALSPAPRRARAPRTVHPSPGARAALSDEHLVALLRRGEHGAFDSLARRYQTRLLWFCWQILRSKEDAEDALQDVFTAAYNALLTDEREIHVRPWLYKIARNRCINHLRRTAPVGCDSMDDRPAAHAGTIVERLVSRQQFQELVADVQQLPDTQRTALLLREIDGFSYRQIAAALDKSVPAVKSLLVRARSGLLASVAARERTCAEAQRSPRAQPGRAAAHARRVSYQAARSAASAAA